MMLHAEAARLQLAAVDGSSASWMAAESRLRAENVRDPIALLRTLMPGRSASRRVRLAQSERPLAERAEAD
jgi:hypothetical protein